MRKRGRLVAGVGLTLVTIAACFLIGQRVTHSSWPLAHARMLLVGFAVLSYFVSFILRARGWRRLFPVGQRPDQARCLASVGAAAASGAVLPFRLDYLVKIGTLRRLSGVRIGLEAIALSIVSLGMVDAVAMLPLSVSATATNSGASLDRRRLRPELLRAAPWKRPTGAPPAGAPQQTPAPDLRSRLCAQVTARDVAARFLPASTCLAAGRPAPSAAPCS